MNKSQINLSRKLSGSISNKSNCFEFDFSNIEIYLCFEYCFLEFHCQHPFLAPTIHYK